MKIGQPLQKLLKKQYASNTVINRKIGSLDVAFKTDESGNPISAFVGKLDADGKIKGDRFVRVLIKDQSGNIIKDHWEGKGKT